nr:pyridoxal 5'-phosphate synthase glutaminase subunit PdxT [Actinoplanes digitatis]
MNIGVLALQGDVREHLSALAESDVLARPVRRPEELEEVDALVIPGGESTTMSNLAITFGLLEPIRKRIAGGMPVYGSCAEHDHARHHGAGRLSPIRSRSPSIDMTVRRNAFGSSRWTRSRPPSRSTASPSPDFHAVFIRAPWVEEVGAEVSVLGRVTSGPAAGRIVAVRQGNLLATAFHPELTGDLRVHRYFVELVRRAADDAR